MELWHFEFLEGGPKTRKSAKNRQKVDLSILVFFAHVPSSVCAQFFRGFVFYPIFADFWPIFVFWALLLKIQSAITPSILGVRGSPSDNRKLSPIPFNNTPNQAWNENSKKVLVDPKQTIPAVPQQKQEKCHFGRFGVVFNQIVRASRVSRWDILHWLILHPRSKPRTENLGEVFWKFL